MSDLMQILTAVLEFLHANCKMDEYTSRSYWVHICHFSLQKRQDYIRFTKHNATNRGNTDVDSCSDNHVGLHKLYRSLLFVGWGDTGSIWYTGHSWAYFTSPR
jgi:hypothetical protein